MSTFDPLDALSGVSGVTETVAETREKQYVVDFANQLRDARQAMAAAAAMARVVTASMAASAAANAAAEASGTTVASTSATTTASGSNVLASLMSTANADLAAVVDETIDDAINDAAANAATQAPTSPDYTAPTWYHPYAMQPLRNPLSAEVDNAGEVVEEATDLQPPMPIDATVPSHSREKYEPDTRIFFRFAKRATAGEIEAKAAALAAALSGAIAARRPEEPPKVEERRERRTLSRHDSGLLYLGRSNDESETNGEADTLTDEERLQILKDMFRFNSGAISYIAASVGVRLPMDFMADPVYLKLTGHVLPPSGKFGAGDEAIREMAAYLRPERVAARTVDFAVSLYRITPADGVPVVARRVYAEGIVGMVGRSYLQVVGRKVEKNPSIGPLERACYLVEGGLDDFVQLGPDSAKNVEGGMYDRLRHWANAWRVAYVDPKNREMANVAENLFRAGPKSRLDAVM